MDGTLRLYVHDRNSLAMIESYFLMDSAGEPFAAANSQGGAFSPIGHFYFSESGPNNLHWFDMVERRHVGSFAIQASDLEGLTLADMDAILSACTGEEACEAGRLRGQLHVADNVEDWIILHHIEVPALEKGKL